MLLGLWNKSVYTRYKYNNLGLRKEELIYIQESTSPLIEAKGETEL